MCSTLYLFIIKVFGDESIELKLEDVKMSDFGEVGEITITKDDTLLIKGKWITSFFDIYFITPLSLI